MPGLCGVTVSREIKPLCVICQNEIWEADPVPWHGANAHGLCADRIEDTGEVEYGAAIGRAVASQHEAGTCGIVSCVCHERLRK